MAKLVFVTVFTTHMCRTKLTKRTKLEKTKRYQTGERNAMLKKL